MGVAHIMVFWFFFSVWGKLAATLRRNMLPPASGGLSLHVVCVDAEVTWKRKYVDHVLLARILASEI